MTDPSAGGSPRRAAGGDALVKRLGDRTMPETGREVGVTRDGAVGWACAQVRAKQDAEPQCKKRVEEVKALCSQPKI